MDEFLKYPKRSIELPLGCKDLIDAIGKQEPNRSSKQLVRRACKLGKLEGPLSRQLQLTGKIAVAGIWHTTNRGTLVLELDTALTTPVIFVSWHGTAEEKAIRKVFAEAGLVMIEGPIGRWKLGSSLPYPLPADAAIAASLIGEVFRSGYGMSDLEIVSLIHFENRPRDKSYSK